jgi:DNA-binding NarL/FixJ family response regulator
MNNGGPIRIMVVDDHPVVRFGLVAMLGAQPDFVVVAQASTAEEAIVRFRQHQPDVCLMDLRLPEIGGAEAIRLISKEFPKSAFIVLTTFHGDEDIHKAMSAGARSYLLQGMSHDELLDAVRKVHAGRQYLSKTVQQSLANRMPSSDLSAREAEILGLIVALEHPIREAQRHRSHPGGSGGPAPRNCGALASDNLQNPAVGTSPRLEPFVAEAAGCIVPVQARDFSIAAFVGVGLAIIVIKREIAVGTTIHPHAGQLLHFAGALDGLSEGHNGPGPNE